LKRREKKKRKRIRSSKIMRLARCLLLFAMRSIGEAFALRSELSHSVEKRGRKDRSSEETAAAAAAAAAAGEHRLRGRRIDENRARQETRKVDARIKRVAREE